jgi:hypothetical protein
MMAACIIDHMANEAGECVIHCYLSTVLEESTHKLARSIFINQEYTWDYVVGEC